MQPPIIYGQTSRPNPSYIASHALEEERLLPRIAAGHKNWGDAQ